MNSRQIEEIAKLFMDIGKLVFVSLVLGFFQSTLSMPVALAYSLIGLTIAFGLFIMAIKLFKEVK